MLNVPGIVSIVIFYLLILFVGIWAGRKTKQDAKGETTQEEVMLAGRNIGLIVGVFTMTATWVCGSYISGTAELLYRTDGGLVWCQAPFGYSLSLVFGGLFFADKMRTAGYVTMIDPFQQKLGKRMGGLLFVPALLGEICWTASVLSALGATLAVIMDLDSMVSVIVSACIAVIYTFFGGLYSVAYTDVVQLFCIFFGLWLCVPFVLINPLVNDIRETAYQRNFTELRTVTLFNTSIDSSCTVSNDSSPAKDNGSCSVTNHTYEAQVRQTSVINGWVGALPASDVGIWIDSMLLLIFGGIPWQVYFQRVLSCKSAARAKTMSHVAAVGCFFLCIAPILIGASAASTDWFKTGYKKDLTNDASTQALPLVLQHLTPAPIAFIGLGAVSAAVMSSADSSVLSASSMFARNIYKNMIRQRATENEIVWVMRVAIFGVGVISTVMAIVIKTVYGLWVFCSDLVYVILFPQLVAVLYLEATNTYGSLSAFFVGLSLRMLGGEALIGIPVILRFPLFDEVTGRQLFPFKTLCTALSIVTIVSVSFLTRYLFESGVLPKHFDVFRCVVNLDSENDSESAAASAKSRQTSNANANELSHVGYVNASGDADANAFTSSASPLMQTENGDGSISK